MKTVLALLAAIASPLSAAPLSGTKSIGPTGDYASIAAAIAEVQTLTLSGPLVLELEPSYLSSVETFPLVFGNLSTTAISSLTLRPQSGAIGLSISSNDTTAATVDLNGAQFLTLDGRPGGVGTAKQLTIANTSSSGRAVRFINEASNNTLRHLTLQGVNTSASGGTVVFSTTTGANGNDNNTINTCDLRDGATLPVNALYSLGSTSTTAQNNSGNTVSNCNVFNFYSTTNDVAGVRLDGGNTGWSITGNSFYQTASRAAVAANVRAIFINNTSGDNFTVTGNFIGGSAANAGGTAWTTTGTSAAYLFQGIRLNVATTTSSSAQGNTIQNISWTTSSSATTQSGIWCGIHAQAGNVNIGTVTGNSIGSGTGTGSISVTTSGTGGTTFGISSASSGTVAIANNAIGSITTSGSATNVSASLVGIQVTGGANTISGNTIGSTATVNSLNAATSSNSSAGQQVTGIFSTSSTSASITGNTVANLKNNYSGNSNSGQIRGIVTSAGINTISGNSLSKLSTTSSNSGTATSSAVLGISQSSTAAGQTVSQNVVHSLANTSNSSVNVIGIYYAGNTSTGPNFITRNLVHSLAIASTSTGSILYGMSFNGGTFTAQNNMVRVGLDASGNSTAGASQLSGIFDGSTSGRNYYYNSVYVGGSQTSGPNRTYALTSTIINSTRNFRNNILVNARTNSGGSGRHYAVQYGGSAANPAGLTANNNLYFVNGTGGVLGIFASVERTTPTAWRTATGMDSASLNADPLFINASGTATSVDLHAQSVSPVANGGSPIPAVSDDFDGEARNSFVPDIGADEFAPANEANLASLSLSGGATFSPGVAANTLIYRSRVASTTSSITVTPSPTNPLATVTVNGGSPATPVALNQGSNTIAIVITAPDGTTKTYTLLVSSLGGTLSIGPTGDYLSVTEVLDDIRVKSLTGPLTLELQPSYVSSVESFPLVFNNLFTTVTNTLTLRPQSGAAGLSISSDYFVTVDLDGTQFVTIDGRAGGVGTAKELTIANTSIEGVALRFVREANGNTLRHLTFRGVNAGVPPFLGSRGGVIFFDGTDGPNGNDNNTIDSCDIGDGASTPANAIYSLGSTNTTEQNNSGNTISNCNVFNFYSPAAVDAAGVRLDGGNTDWSITGNSFFQTASRAGVAANVRAVFINNTSGNNFIITGNFVGGSAPNAGGTAWTTTGTAARYLFKGIQLNVGTTTASSVQGNTIRNITWTTSGTTNDAFSIWSGIAVPAGSANIGTVTGNTIGSATGTDSISVTTSGTLGSTFGIGSESSGQQISSSLAVVNNNVGSNTTNASLIGIQTSAPTVSIANNMVGSTTTANSLNATMPSAATTQKVAGIIGSAESASITGNTVANLNSSYSGTSSAGQIIGIANYAVEKTVTGNTVRNLSTVSRNPEKRGSASVLGILAGSSLGPFSSSPIVSGNVVHSLLNSTTSASVEVAGIYCSGESSSPSLIAGNMVHSLSIDSTSASSRLYGMNFERGAYTVQNNMVRVGLDASGVSTAGASSVAGIFESGSFNEVRNFYHNSVFVGGTQTAGVRSTSAYASSDFYTRRVFRNNIFVNARSNSGATSKHYAFGSNVFSTLIADNNIYFVSGSGGMLGYYDGADCSTLAALQVATRQDGSSAVADPLFVNPVGDAGDVDLHLQPGNPAEGGGLPIAAVSDDFDGQPRSSLSPVDIGADAGNFSSTGDIFPPAISYPLLAPVGLATNRVLSGWANFVDNSGTVESGPNAPRLYFKKSTDSDVFNVANDSSGNGWKYVTGNDGGGGSYSFTIDYTLISGGSVSEGDSIQYFVVAQDAANNLGSSPLAATASANPPVQNINAKPVAGVNSYSIAPSGGTVTVGPGGNFPDLTGANGLFVALNTVPLTSNLIVKITGDVVEDGRMTLNSNTADITIQPDSPTMRTISGSGFNGLIRLSGANGVTIDGSFGGSGRYLTFRNTNTNGATITLINDASNNTIRNCVLEGNTASSSSGVVFFSTGLTTGNDNNTVAGNHIRDRSDVTSVPANLVYSSGTSDAVANSNNTISNNELSNFLARGLYVAAGSDSWNVIENTIYQTVPRSDDIHGITFNGLGTNMIRGNTVRDLLSDSRAYGIQSYNGNTTVTDNRLRNLGNTAASNSVVGIIVYPNAGQMVTAVNNMVALSSFGTTAQSLSGIQVGGKTGGTAFISHNTVLISGSGSAQTATSAFEISGYATATVKNNIFLNVRAGGGSHRAAAQSSSGLLTMDYNVYAGTGMDTAANFFFDASTGTPINFAQWQALVPGDTHSSAGNPGGNYTSAMFVDPANGNLHLVPTGNVLVNNTGTPVAGVTTDYDGDTRSLTTPDIGADELRPAFQQWAQANAVGDDPNSPGANGLANLLNFAFGLNPASASRNELSHLGNVITPGGITTQILNGTPTAKFIRRADYVAAGLTYTAQFSADLSSWETDNTAPTVLATDGVNEVAGLNYPLLSGGAQARFFRVVVGLQ